MFTHTDLLAIALTLVTILIIFFFKQFFAYGLWLLETNYREYANTRQRYLLLENENVDLLQEAPHDFNDFWECSFIRTILRRVLEDDFEQKGISS